MNRKFRVIRINGPIGLIIALVAIGIIIGSITVAPIYGVKFLWNNFISNSFGIQTIRLSQASLLWFAIVAATVGYLKNKICFKLIDAANFEDTTLSNPDYEKFMEKIKKEQEEHEKIHH